MAIEKSITSYLGRRGYVAEPAFNQACVWLLKENKRVIELPGLELWQYKTPKETLKYIERKIDEYEQQTH